jgi:hypothetical protein
MSILKVNEIRPRTTGASVDVTVPFGLKGYSTTDRDNLTSLSAGETIWNTTTSRLQVYNGSGWTEFITSSDVSGGASIGLVLALGG